MNGSNNVNFNPNEPNSTIDGTNNGNNGIDFTTFDKVESITISDDNLTVLQEAGANGFDKDNNLVNDKGEVLLSSDKFDINDFNSLSKDEFLKKYFDSNSAGGNGDNGGDNDTTAIIIDDTEYTLDKDGNAVDKDGNIFKTVDELKELEQITDDDNNIIEELSKLDNYELVDEQGNPLEFENSPQGIIDRTKEIVRRESARLVQEQIKNFFTENEDIRKLYEYKQVHGTIDGYDNFTDYTKVEIKSDDISTQKQIVKTIELSKGKPVDAVERYLKYLEQEGLLEQEAKDDLTVLQTKQKSELEQAQFAKQEQLRLKQEEDNKFISQVEQIVNNGKIGDIVIPENLKVKDSNGAIQTVPRKALLDFMFKPVTEQGHTMAQLKRAERMKDVNNIVLDELQLFLDYNAEQLITDNAKHKNIQRLITTKKQNNTSGRVIKFKTNNNNKSAINNINL